jgi:MATE family multidrug resistance protein
VAFSGHLIRHLLDSDMPSLGLELRTIARLSIPVALAQLGMTAMAAVDTLLLGHVGVDELAACALGNVWEWTWLCLGFGLVMGTEALISQAHGRGDGPATALALQRGIVLAGLASVPIGVALVLTRQGLELLGQDPSVAALAGRYNLYKLPVVPCFLVYTALRQYLQGRTLMAPATIVMWLGNGLHVPLSLALIFGFGPISALGIRGAAIAESITFVLLVLGLVGWICRHRLHDGAWRPWSRESFEPRGLLQAARLGVPVSMQIAFEAWAFSLAALMAGWIDRDAIGSHQIALNLAVLSFMLPLGVSQAASTRVGNLIGAGDGRGMRQAVKASLLLGAGVMLLPALGFTLLNAELPRLYSSEPGVVAVATQLLPIAAAFQLFDGTQVVAGAMLRGMGRPDGGAALSLIGYYVIALPLGYVLGLVMGFGLVGVWIGLAVGVITVAGTLVALLARTARRPLLALQLDIERVSSAPPDSSDVLAVEPKGSIAA